MAKNEIMEGARFRRTVLNYYRKHGRHSLPWRKTKDPYKILVSEIMLQQTQVDRVLPFYKTFIRRFPNSKKLARTPLSSVLKVWQGLGYNRRAKMLHEAAKYIEREYDGKVPRHPRELETLPGVGSYTARAVAAFAFDDDVIMIETNIRTAVIHNFFSRKKKVPDADIERALITALPRGKSREWYAALMDYGAHLKRSGIALNARSKHYAKQSAFKGSVREARGAILRALTQKPRTKKELLQLWSASRAPQVEQALHALTKEGFIEKKHSYYFLAR